MFQSLIGTVQLVIVNIKNERIPVKFQSLIGTVQRIMITLLSIVGLINYVSISHRYGSTYYGYVRVSSNRFQSLIGTVQHIVKEQD